MASQVQVRCGNCAWAVPYREDSGAISLTKKICLGGRPTPTLVQTPQGPQQLNLDPVVDNAMQRPCFTASKQAVALVAANGAVGAGEEPDESEVVAPSPAVEIAN